MTERIVRRPDGTNRVGNGRGVGLVTKPQPKKRGLNKDRTAQVAKVRAGRSTTNNAGAALVSPDKPLTDKQRLFVKLWAQGETIATASARAGYNDSAAYAYRMVKMPNILKLYNAEKAAYEEASQMTRKRVMDGLLEGIEMCKLTADGPGVINGWKTVGQMCGYFEPVKRRLDINVNGQLQVQHMSKMSDAELLRVIQQGAAAELQLLEQTVPGDPDEEPE